MPRDPHASSAGPGEQPINSPPQAGYAGVARRISRLTMNILATAVVLILLLLLGQNLGDLWRSSTAKTQPLPAPLAAAKGLRESAATVQFGQGKLAWMQSQVLGDREAAAQELHRVCREAGSASHAHADRPSADAEQRLLAMLEDQAPAEQLDPQTELFLLPGAIPLAVVTKNGVLAAAGRDEQGGKVAALRRRVVVWGIALPREKNAWTVYAFRPQEGADGESGDVPLPPGAIPILSVRKHEGSVSAFRGDQVSQLDSWRTFTTAGRPHGT